MEKRIKYEIMSELFLTQTEFFNYLSKEERLETAERMRKQHSICVGVKYNDESLKYAIIIDFHEDFIHINHVGGKFFKHLDDIDIFVMAFAKFRKAKKITFDSKHKAVISVVKKLGYKKDENGTFTKNLTW